MPTKLNEMLMEKKTENLNKTASRIRYEITSGNIGGAFAVKNMTGAIYVAGALDYETRRRVSVCFFSLRRFGRLLSTFFMAYYYYYF